MFRFDGMGIAACDHATNGSE